MEILYVRSSTSLFNYTPTDARIERYCAFSRDNEIRKKGGCPPKRHGYLLPQNIARLFTLVFSDSKGLNSPVDGKNSNEGGAKFEKKEKGEIYWDGKGDVARQRNGRMECKLLCRSSVETNNMNIDD